MVTRMLLGGARGCLSPALATRLVSTWCALGPTHAEASAMRIVKRRSLGVGIVRVEDRSDSDIDDVWSALTDPRRLARWMGERSPEAAAATDQATGPARGPSHGGHAGRGRQPDHPGLGSTG